MDPRFSQHTYPRMDKAYQLKSSYNFETIEARVYLNRNRSKCEEFHRLIAHALIGFLVGTIAFSMNYLEEYLVEKHAHLT